MSTGGTLGETRLGVESNGVRSRVMELETQNELLIESACFYIRINPVEIEHRHYPSFLAEIKCIISTPSKAQFNYSGDMWIGFDDFQKFVTDIQKIVAGKIEQAQLVSMSQFALFTICKNHRSFNFCICIEDDTSYNVEKTILTASFIEEYDFINILSRSATEFWRTFKHLFI